MDKTKKGKKNQTQVSRRDFLRYTGITVASTSLGVMTVGNWDNLFADGSIVIPSCDGYICVDPKRCQGCLSCMLSCSLVHEGEFNLSKSRLQFIQNKLEAWPNDIVIHQCYQCDDAPCVKACHDRGSGALIADPANGNVRRVDRDKCWGCRQCVKACPYIPARPVVIIDPAYHEPRARKCDLCVDAPYHRDADGNPVQGGPGGTQACVAVCPLGAIVYKPASEISGDPGPENLIVNLRADDPDWAAMGYPID